MLKKEAVSGRGGRVILMDSITKVAAEDKGTIVVCASHGGTSSGEFALEVPLKLVVFNDAGVGKDRAGIAGLRLLQEAGLAALAVAHESARIGQADSTLRDGVVSHLNEAALALGFVSGKPLLD